jgi:hypothetical protein
MEFKPETQPHINAITNDAQQLVIRESKKATNRNRVG